ncbi:hypothetical protein L5515_005649 [Caenorhabditis briggsae]|uniref:Uncharacterized protein n=1 Tax=Caenorhabditis briggsae TaxID=6238 RepID=A0AAE9EP02_CAEBR|nr:hypothetical protein L5515_005649 [Caenorhabditis briggsae]
MLVVVFFMNEMFPDMSATTPMRRKRATNLRQGEDDDSGELVRKRNARMAVFSAMVDCTPSTSTNNNNNRNYHEEDEEDDESRTTLLKSMSLKSLLKLKCETINKFLNFFDATHQARSNSKDPKYPIDLLPDCLEFHVMFRGAMSGENCPFMQAIRISSVSDETLRKAASATVHFFSFMTLRRNKVKERPSVPQCDYEMERVKRMTTVEKANLVGEFFCWFERVPPVRVSSSKVVATNGVEARVQVKETNTLMTTIRGLLAFWTYVGVIEPSSDRSPTEESRSIWRVVRSVVKVTEKMKGGRLDISKSSLSFSDTIRLMKKSDGVSSMFGLQSWILALLLGGLGVRIGSVRNSFPPVSDAKSTEKSPHPSSSRSSFDGFDESEVEDKADDDNDNDDVLFAFDGLKGSDLRVWRRRKRDGDPAGSIRLRASINITHSKMNGTEVFSPKSIGCEYPLVSSDNGEDWSLNVAVVLAMLSCLVGTTRAEQYFCDYGELAESGEEIELTVRKSELNDTPLFRESNKYHNLLPGQMRNVHNALSLVAKSLKIPPALFSSRSYRSGYARDVIQGIVTRGDPQRDIPLQALRSNLLSGTQWKSAQVDRYLSNLSRSLALHPVTFAHTTALDWQSAIYGELASTKSDFEEVNPTNVNIYIRSKSSKPDESLARLSSMDPAEIITLCDEINIDNWRKCAPVPLTHQERREFLQKNTMVDVFSTFQSLKMVIDQNMRPFCGYGVSSPYACPVVNCEKSGALHSLASTHEHWKLWHEESKKNLTYMCIKCSNTGPSNLKSYSRHLKIRHKMEPFNFNFSFI